MKSSVKNISDSKIVLNVLLADDDNDDQLFFDKALKSLPISTNLTTVNDGEQLMEYLLENSERLPNVLFLDINMPRKNGFECLFEIKHSEKLKDIPVAMFSTAYPRDINYESDMIKRLLKIGAYDFIRKPDNFKELKKVISDSLEKVIEKMKVEQ